MALQVSVGRLVCIVAIVVPLWCELRERCKPLFKQLFVDRGAPKCGVPVFSKTFGNLLGIGVEFPISHLKSPYGVAAARLEFLQLREYIVFPNAGAEIRTVFFDVLLRFLQLICEVLSGQIGRVILEIAEALGVASVRISRINVCGDMWILQIFAVHFLKVGGLRCPNEAESAIELLVIGSGFGENMVMRHAIGDGVHGYPNEDPNILAALKSGARKRR